MFRLKSLGDDRLRFLLDPPQVLRSAEAFRVQFVDLFRAGWPRGKPSSFRDHLHATDWLAVTRRACQDLLDLFAGQMGRVDTVRREILQNLLLLGGRGRVDTLVSGVSEFPGELSIHLAGIALRSRGY